MGYVSLHSSIEPFGQVVEGAETWPTFFPLLRQGLLARVPPEMENSFCESLKSYDNPKMAMSALILERPECAPLRAADSALNGNHPYRSKKLDLKKAVLEISVDGGGTFVPLGKAQDINSLKSAGPGPIDLSLSKKKPTNKKATKKKPTNKKPTKRA